MLEEAARWSRRWSRPSGSTGSWGTDAATLQRDTGAPSSQAAEEQPPGHRHVRHSHRSTDSWDRSED